MMKVTGRSAQRASLIGLAATLLCVPALVGASTGAQATPIQKHFETAISSVPQLSEEAWRAGKAEHGASTTAQQAVESYWTVSRMKAAKDIADSPELRTAEKRFDEELAAQQRQAKQGNGPARETQGPEQTFAPASSTVAAMPEAAAGTESASGLLPMSNPDLAYWHPTARTNGKVFFTMDGQNYACSASVVNSAGKNTVWTAGHCVHGGRGGSWATNWSFVPAYDDDLANPRPYGTWTARQLWALTSWTGSSDFTSDMAVAVMNPRNGHHIVNYLGGHGLRINASKSTSMNIFGYSAVAPLDGGNLRKCQGTSSPEVSFLWWSSDTLKVSCSDMNRGASGGPWLANYGGGYGYLNGINSRVDSYTNPRLVMSAYFDDSALTLYNATTGL
ncbi:MAG: trypsin-like serine peptidase [Actinomycetales bacterium]